MAASDSEQAAPVANKFGDAVVALAKASLRVQGCLYEDPENAIAIRRARRIVDALLVQLDGAAADNAEMGK